jgi:hypothetical protein
MNTLYPEMLISQYNCFQAEQRRTVNQEPGSGASPEGTAELQTCPNWIFKMPRFRNRPFLARTVARKGRLLDERAVAEPRHCLNPMWAADDPHATGILFRQTRFKAINKLHPQKASCSANLDNSGLSSAVPTGLDSGRSFSRRHAG